MKGNVILVFMMKITKEYAPSQHFFPLTVCLFSRKKRFSRLERAVKIQRKKGES